MQEQNKNAKFQQTTKQASSKLSKSNKNTDEPKPSPLIRTSSLTKRFKSATTPVIAVDEVDLDIYQGETLGLVGESGCGKSTLGRLLVGLEQPSSGSIYYGDRAFAAMKSKERKSVRKEIQMVFQDPYSALNPRKTIGEIFRAPLLYHGIANKKNVEKHTIELLSQVGLSRRSIHRYPHEFSGGQRQRICIAQALSLNPQTIVCDEPVSALDVSIQAQILNLLKRLQKELNLTYLFIAHGLGAISYISDRVAVMYLGKIVEIAHVKEMFLNPMHPYTIALYNAAPVLNPREREKKEKVLLEGEAIENLTEHGCKFYSRCSYRMPKCALKHPPLIDIPGEYGAHKVACYYVHEFGKIQS